MHQTCIKINIRIIALTTNIFSVLIDRIMTFMITTYTND